MADLAIVGPIGVRRFTLEKVCESHEGHSHNYDHTTIVIRGRVKVAYRYERDGQLIDGETREYAAGEYFVCLAKVHHTIKALEDDTAYVCIFSHRDFDGIVVQAYVGNAAAYH